MYDEGQPRRLDLKAADRVRVPNPRGEGKVHATVITRAEPGDKARVAWVRYTDGPEAGALDRVDCAYIEPA